MTELMGTIPDYVNKDDNISYVGGCGFGGRPGCGYGFVFDIGYGYAYSYGHGYGVGYGRGDGWGYGYGFGFGNPDYHKKLTEVFLYD